METPDPGTAELELDSESLFEAMDRERRHRRLTRAQACAELGISPTSWSSWSAGATIGAGSALRISLWIDRDLRDFAKPRAKARAA
jgi:transcriptional regulator with XRE-family HTH domain